MIVRSTHNSISDISLPTIDDITTVEYELKDNLTSKTIGTTNICSDNVSDEKNENEKLRHISLKCTCQIS